MDPHRPPQSASEHTDALADVLRDQAERERRRTEASRPPVDRGPLLRGISFALLGAAAWLLVAPPQALRPPPPPPPPPHLVEAELRMTVYQVAMRLNFWLDSAGVLPATLDQAFEGPEDIEGITWERVARDRFRLTGRREDALVRYETGDPLDALVAETRRVLEEASP